MTDDIEYILHELDHGNIGREEARTRIRAVFDKEREGDIDLGLCVGFYSNEDEDYSFAPASGRFPLEKINGKKGQLIFRPAKGEK